MPGTPPPAPFDPANQAPLVSVVTPTFNRRHRVARLLGALGTQTCSSFEVVVVDDGSTDGTLDYLQGLRPPFPLSVLRQAHGGPALARTLGVQAAHGRYVLFLDDDVIPSPDVVARHVATHTQAGPRAVVIGPMLPPHDRARSAWVRWEERGLLRQYAAMRMGVYPCTARQFFTGNASLERTFFLAAGGFDPEFQRAEDVELGYRLDRLGATWVFDPDADVLHEPDRAFAAWCRMAEQYGHYDVVMGRDRHHPAMRLAAEEFGRRHLALRLVAYLLVGRPARFTAAVALLQRLVVGLNRAHAYRLAQPLLSVLYHLLYWHGFCVEIGGPRTTVARAHAAALTLSREDR